MSALQQQENEPKPAAKLAPELPKVTLPNSEVIAFLNLLFNDRDKPSNARWAMKHSVLATLRRAYGCDTHDDLVDMIKADAAEAEMAAAAARIMKTPAAPEPTSSFRKQKITIVMNEGLRDAMTLFIGEWMEKEVPLETGGGDDKKKGDKVTATGAYLWGLEGARVRSLLDRLRA